MARVCTTPAFSCAPARRLRLACRASLREAPPSILQRASIAIATTAVAIGAAVSPALAGSVSFTAPVTDAKLSSPVHVAFAVEGLTVRPAKDGLVAGTGHFHVLVDEGSAPAGVALPFDDMHLHYGKGQMEADIPLPTGPHVLTLQFADATHVSYGPEYSSSIKVIVE